MDYLDMLRHEKKIRKVTAGTLAPNIGMRRVFEKVGMHHEATKKCQELFEGRPMDMTYYACFLDK